MEVQPRGTESELPGGDGLPVFLVEGSVALGEFRCADCGYGIVSRRVLPACPMCRGRSWESPLTSPLGRLRA